MRERAVKAETGWLAALREPRQALAWSEPQWERHTRIARHLRLLARLAQALEAAALLDAVPAAARRHLEGELRLSRWRTTALRWTLCRVDEALQDAPYPRVLLKGAAYAALDLPISRGRMPADVDILVPRPHLEDARARLARAGWEPVPLDAHDRRYYHDWSHELPPMRHGELPLELDVHHAILPPVARTTVDTGRLLGALVPGGWGGWQVLQPVDLVLHCAAHLFHDAQARERLRDIVDLDGLLRHHGSDDAFWEALPARAEALGLGLSLALAAQLCTRWLATPIPPAARAAIERTCAGGPGARWLRGVMQTVLEPTDPATPEPWMQRAGSAWLALRYHAWRLPPHLLLAHAWHRLAARGAPSQAGRPQRLRVFPPCPKGASKRPGSRRKPQP